MRKSLAAPSGRGGAHCKRSCECENLLITQLYLMADGQLVWAELGPRIDANLIVWCPCEGMQRAKGPTQHGDAQRGPPSMHTGAQTLHFDGDILGHQQISLLIHCDLPRVPREVEARTCKPHAPNMYSRTVSSTQKECVCVSKSKSGMAIAKVIRGLVEDRF